MYSTLHYRCLVLFLCFLHYGMALLCMGGGVVWCGVVVVVVVVETECEGGHEEYLALLQIMYASGCTYYACMHASMRAIETPHHPLSSPYVQCLFVLYSTLLYFSVLYYTILTLY